MGTKQDGKKRFWAEEEKREICAQPREPGVSVAQVAQRYYKSANLIHKWFRDSHFASDEEACEVLDATEAGFVPVEIIESVLVPPSFDMRVSALALTGPVSAQRVETTLSDGWRILSRSAPGRSPCFADPACSSEPPLVESLVYRRNLRRRLCRLNALRLDWSLGAPASVLPEKANGLRRMVARRFPMQPVLIFSTPARS